MQANLFFSQMVFYPPRGAFDSHFMSHMLNGAIEMLHWVENLNTRAKSRQFWKTICEKRTEKIKMWVLL